MTIATVHPCEPRAKARALGRRDQVVLRPLTACDLQPMIGFFERLDPESRRLRFHQYLPVVKPWLVRQLVDVDQSSHVAWAAWAGDEIVGEARYVRSPVDRREAEVAFSVADDMRRRGLATRMLEALGLLARADGVETFTSTVGTDNRASAALLAGMGSSFSFADGVLEGRGPVPSWTGTPDAAMGVLLQRELVVPVETTELAA